MNITLEEMEQIFGKEAVAEAKARAAEGSPDLEMIKDINEIINAHMRNMIYACQAMFGEDGDAFKLFMIQFLIKSLGLVTSEMSEEIYKTILQHAMEGRFKK